MNSCVTYRLLIGEGEGAPAIKEELMAYKFIKDGVNMIHFENGLWDNLWGYTCRNCGRAFGDTESAYEHDCLQPCRDEDWCETNKFTWRTRLEPQL